MDVELLRAGDDEPDTAHDMPTEQLIVAALTAVVTLTKAYSMYTDRRAGQRTGRRATDLANGTEHAALTRLERAIGELACSVADLGARVKALEPPPKPQEG